VSLIGDLERALASSLYPNRVPVAIGLVVALVLLLVIARRRRWFAVARRHPLRTGVLIAALLVIGVPTGWYLGSPLFITVSLEEPAPSVPTVDASPTPSSIAGPAATPQSTGPAAVASQPPVVMAPRTGSFEGADEFHFGRGTASLIETSPGMYVLRFEDFSVRNGPDLYVYLSPDPKGYSRDAIELGRLKATDGSFNTPIPDGADVSAIRSVVIWCKQFSVQFAVARLS
jgi:hypothetical protein